MPNQTKPAPTTPAQPAPPAHEADIQERIAKFNQELLPLLGKYELGISAIPKIVQGGVIAADPVITSVRKAPTATAPIPAEATAPSPTKPCPVTNPDA